MEFVLNWLLLEDVAGVGQQKTMSVEAFLSYHENNVTELLIVDELSLKWNNCIVFLLVSRLDEYAIINDIEPLNKTDTLSPVMTTSLWAWLA